jgi:hypothetical protein
MKHLKISILFLTVLATFSCSKDDDSEPNDQGFDGSINAIENYFSPESVQALEELGFIFHPGDNPPIINGTYFVSPYILEASTVPGDYPGMSFADLNATYSEQDNEALSIAYSYINGNESGSGIGAFISGSDNKFSVYVKTTSYIGSTPAQTAQAFSGKLTSDGIENFQSALLMLDDNGDPEGVYIENNTGRLLTDSDGWSPKQ